MSRKGVESALRKADPEAPGEITPNSYKKIAELLGTSLQFIYKSQKKGFLPPDRARTVADAYGIPLADLVSPANRALLNAQ